MGFIEGAQPTSAALALSANGTYAAGWCDSDAVRWFGLNVEVLGRLPAPFDALAVAYGVSGDGSTVVGFGRGAQVGSALWGFVWRADRGIVPIGAPPSPGSFYGSYATGISEDGSVVVGSSDVGTGYPRAFALGPVREWGALTDDPSTASAVSADGSVVVGVVNVNDVDTPFRWSEGTGIVLLGDLPGGDAGGVAYAVNADGTVIVGGSPSASSNPSYAYEAFRWSAAGGIVALGDLPGGDYTSEARAVSANGSVIVGLSGISPSPRTAAFIWDPAHGMRNLRTVLMNNYALDLTGWELSTAQAISADGRTIVGRGINPSGQFEGWIAHLERRCRADWNEDGVVTTDDFFAFVDTFLCQGDDADCGSADFNQDGVENSSDFFDYVVAFIGVCS